MAAYRIMVNEYAAAGLLTELGAAESELRTLGEGRALERQCPLGELEAMISRGLLRRDDFVDVGNGWEKVDRCARFAGACRALESQAETGRWIVAGLVVAVVLVAAFRLLMH